MKNLFSINKTVREVATGFDENGYMKAHVSDAVRDKLKRALDPLDQEPAPASDSAEVAAQKRVNRRNWIISGAAFAIALVLFYLDGQRGEGTPVDALTFASVLFALVSIVFGFLARRGANKLHAASIPAMGKDDWEAAVLRLDEVAREAARDLGVPEDAASLEVFPYHYTVKNGIPVDAMKKNHFDNISVSAWVDAGNLCMASAQELFCVPLTDIRGYRTVDEEFVVDFWLKEEEFDSETYKDYNIRKAGFTARKCRTYYAVTVSGAEGEYEFFVPCYDLDILTGLTGVKPL